MSSNRLPSNIEKNYFLEVVNLTDEQLDKLRDFFDAFEDRVKPSDVLCCRQTDDSWDAATRYKQERVFNIRMVLICVFLNLVFLVTIAIGLVRPGLRFNDDRVGVLEKELTELKSNLLFCN